MRIPDQSKDWRETEKAMCIMEVRPGQQSSTIAQAMAHNTNTVIGDMDMLEELLKARGDFESLATVQHAHGHLKSAYAGLLMQFGTEVAKEVQDENGHVHQSVGNERTFVEQAHHDAKLARRFETR
jgi:hypothetical protein